MAVAADELPSEQESENEVTEVVDYAEVVATIDSEMTRLGWDRERGERHLIEQYGLRSRIKLSDEQLLEFLEYLKSQPTFKVGQTALFRGVKVVIERFVNDVVILVRDLEKPKSKCFEVAKCHLRFT